MIGLSVGVTFLALTIIVIVVRDQMMRKRNRRKSPEPSIESADKPESATETLIKEEL